MKLPRGAGRKLPGAGGGEKNGPDFNGGPPLHAAILIAVATCLVHGENENTRKGGESPQTTRGGPSQASQLRKDLVEGTAGPPKKGLFSSHKSQ